MRRVAFLTLVLLAVDQATRAAAEHLLAGKTLLLVEGVGLTYVTNPGLWVWSSTPPAWALGIQLAGQVFLVPLLLQVARYRRVYRSSLLVDAGMAFFVTVFFGNVLDRLLFGYARDWIVTPIAIANLADLAVWPALALWALELWRHPPARALLSLDPRRRWEPVPVQGRRHEAG